VQPEAVQSGTAFNPLDVAIRAGFVQQMFPVAFPRIPSYDVAGVITEAGEGVSGWSVGDRPRRSRRRAAAWQDRPDPLTSATRTRQPPSRARGSFGAQAHRGTPTQRRMRVRASVLFMIAKTFACYFIQNSSRS
jgi:Alcohol dehydrogenase GroES-like domain